MLVGFAGTPPFAATVLDAILTAGYPVPLVFTQPDRAQGRGMKLDTSAVKRLALERSLPMMQPPTLQGIDARDAVMGVAMDVLVVAAYGLLLPRALLDWPRLGCINVHASLLPRWRGAAPIERALLAGDAETGVTIMQMEAGLDTGPMLRRTPVPIGSRETAGELREKLGHVGAKAIVDVLAQLARDDSIAAVPQSVEGVTYAAKITRGDTTIDWQSDARAIDRQIRAFDPVPGAVTTFAGQPVKVYAASPATADAADFVAGTVLSSDSTGIVIACGHGALRVTEVQPAAGRKMAAAAFAAGRRIKAGAYFGAAPPHAARKH